MPALSSSVYLYARPETNEQFLAFFTSIIDLKAAESSDAPGSPEPIYGFPRRNGVQQYG